MAGRLQTVRGFGGVDTRDFAKFAKALRKRAPMLALDLRRNLRGAGEEVATIVRKNAEAIPSKKIPKSVKVRISGATLYVVAGGKNAPNAAPIENKGKEGKFRHPLWGSWEWSGNHTEGKDGDPRNQTAHPFFRRGLQEGLPAAEKAAIDALDTAVSGVIADAKE